MNIRGRVVVGLLLVGALIAGITLIRTGLYGFTLFVISPVFVGGVGAWVFRPTSASKAAGIGALSTATSCLALLFMGLEGLACIAMAIPLAAPLGAVGGYVVYVAGASLVRSRSATLLLVLPISSLTWDKTVRPPVFEVRTEMVIRATPELVWKCVIQFPDITEAREWYFRTGLAYPIRARINGSSAGAVRTCDFSTGAVVERIETWDEPRLLQFQVIENPASIEEWSFYPKIEPKHLHGYLVGKRGQFRLTPVAGGRTLVQATSWYQHGLWPAEYWRWWSDAIFHRIHQRVLNHIRIVAEGDPTAPHPYPKTAILKDE